MWGRYIRQNFYDRRPAYGVARADALSQPQIVVPVLDRGKAAIHVPEGKIDDVGFPAQWPPIVLCGKLTTQRCYCEYVARINQSTVLNLRR